jgi:hypothetical protein
MSARENGDSEGIRVSGAQEGTPIRSELLLYKKPCYRIDRIDRMGIQNSKAANVATVARDSRKSHSFWKRTLQVVDMVRTILARLGDDREYASGSKDAGMYLLVTCISIAY